MELSERQKLADRFRHSGIEECHDSSPLYEVFALTVAEDDDLLDLASHCRVGQPPANLLFAAVHDLLLRGADHPLREFYPAFTERVRPCSESGEFFKDFCMGYRAEIEALIKVRLVQTNEVRRCVCLQAAFATAVQQFAVRPLALVEVGPSAGFNLCWDLYDYGSMGWPSDSEVEIHTEWRGSKRPPCWTRQPEINYRAGVDLNLINLDDEDERRWLYALVWPEHDERLNRLAKVIEIRRQQKLELQQGDALECLMGLAEKAPKESLLCIYHTWVANQMTSEQRETLVEEVATIGRSRDLCHVHNDLTGHLHLTYFRDGSRHDMPLANVDGHASWVEWLA